MVECEVEWYGAATVLCNKQVPGSNTSEGWSDLGGAVEDVGGEDEKGRMGVRMRIKVKVSLQVARSHFDMWFATCTLTNSSKRRRIWRFCGLGACATKHRRNYSVAKSFVFPFRHTTSSGGVRANQSNNPSDGCNRCTLNMRGKSPDFLLSQSAASSLLRRPSACAAPPASVLLCLDWI